MLKKTLLLKVNNLVEAYQFHKDGPAWNREYSNFIDVIDLQISKSGDKFTVNAGVAERSILHICWNIDSSIPIDEPSCTVRTRLGELTCGRDVWWALTDAGSVDEVLREIVDEVIPFFHMNHSIDGMISSLDRKLLSRSYPPESIYLALLYLQKGDTSRGFDMLKTLKAKLTGGWREKVSEILNELS